MTRQQQDAIWPAVQSIWATRNHRLIVWRLGKLLGIKGTYRYRLVARAGLDRTQSREAFFARLAQLQPFSSTSCKRAQHWRCFSLKCMCVCHTGVTQ